jgi:two-component system alkaline phosphatase synthesis response regulator PhoP
VPALFLRRPIAPAGRERLTGILHRAATPYNRWPCQGLSASHSHARASMTSADRSRILIADDNPTNVELLEAFLADLEFDVQVAVDGRDTLDKVATFHPHLILLDVMMPRLSGLEVCRQLKSDPATRGVMVLMVTALNELGDIERAVDAGTDDFLSKPVNKLELVKRVQNMLRLRHITDEVERLRRYIEGMEESDGLGE